MDTMTIWLISATAITVTMSLVVWLIVICTGRVMARINTMYDRLVEEVHKHSNNRLWEKEARQDRHLLTEDIYFDLYTVNKLWLDALGTDTDILRRICATFLEAHLPAELVEKATESSFVPCTVKYAEDSNELQFDNGQHLTVYKLTPVRRLLIICIKIMCVKDEMPVNQRWAMNDFDIALKLYKTDFLFCQIVDAGDDGLKRVLNNAISCHCEKATSHC